MEPPRSLKRGFSVLRRSSVVAQRRQSKDFGLTQEDLYCKPCNDICGKRRASINQLNNAQGQRKVPSASILRRNSIAIVRRSSKDHDALELDRLSRSVALSGHLPSVKENEYEEEVQQHDYKDTTDACSLCSELTELEDECDFVDPDDWFLEEPDGTA